MHQQAFDELSKNQYNFYVDLLNKNYTRLKEKLAEMEESELTDLLLTPDGHGHLPIQYIIHNNDHEALKILLALEFKKNPFPKMLLYPLFFDNSSQNTLTLLIKKCHDIEILRLVLDKFKNTSVQAPILLSILRYNNLSAINFLWENVRIDSSNKALIELSILPALKQAADLGNYQLLSVL